MNSQQPQIVIVSSTRTATGSNLLYRASLGFDCDSKIVAIDQDDAAEMINIADKAIYRLGPKSYEKYEEIAKLVTGKHREELDSVLASFDKIKAQDVLKQASISFPESWTIDRHYKFQGQPIVLKVAVGNQGRGVSLIKSQLELDQYFDEYKDQTHFLAQEFIAEALSRDKRLFVVGEEVVAAMKRESFSGDFRANLHLGGEASAYEPTEEEIQIALKSVKAFDLIYAGVDIIDSDKGPLVLEVNPSPGFAGINRISGTDIAAEVIRHTLER